VVRCGSTHQMKGERRSKRALFHRAHYRNKNMSSKPFSPKEKHMHILCITLLTLLILPLSVWSKDVHLFSIQRSKNANEVQYRLHVDDHCHIVSAQPVDAFWKLLQDSPEKTKPLTAFDHIAYGAVHQSVDENWVSFQLKSLEQRSVKATAIYDPHTGTCSPIVHTEINAQWAALHRIYVQAEERPLRPRVLYIDLFGKSLEANPKEVHERIHP
jgi:hypothetical protein